MPDIPQTDFDRLRILNRGIRVRTRKIDAILDAAAEPTPEPPPEPPPPDPDPEPPPPPPASGLGIGVYVGNGLEVQNQGGAPLTAHEALIGRQVEWIVDFIPSEDITLGSWSPLWYWTQLSPSRQARMVGVPMNPGEPIGNYAILAPKLASGTVVRLGWEMNGTWYDWSTAGDDGWFASSWQRIHRTMKSANPNLVWCWNPTNGENWPKGKRFDPDGAWPGDDYVDLIGVDVYHNRWAPAGTAQEQWDHLVDQDHGLRFWRDFAKAHDRPLCYPEWGTELDSDLFVRKMFQFFGTYPTHSACYWDYNAGDMSASLDSNPKAKVAYVAAVKAL